jgi:hypothetical protein
MMKIVEKHHLLRIYRFAEKLVYVDETLKETQNLEEAMKKIEGDRFTSRFAAQEDIVNAVMSDVCSTIKRCAAFSSHPTATATATATAQHDSASASDSTKGSTLSFEDSILRPSSASTIKNSSKFASWRNGSLERLLRDNVTVDSSTGLTQHAGRREATSHRGTGSAQEASEALDALTSCFLSIDQMLQLRFQMKGAAHFETLAGISAASSTFTPSSPSSSSAAVSPQDSEDTDEDKDKDAEKEELMTPAAVYEVSDSQHNGESTLALFCSSTWNLMWTFGVSSCHSLSPPSLSLPLHPLCFALHCTALHCTVGRANPAPQEVWISLHSSRVGYQVRDSDPGSLIQDLYSSLSLSTHDIAV